MASTTRMTAGQNRPAVAVPSLQPVQQRDPRPVDLVAEQRQHGRQHGRASPSTATATTSIVPTAIELNTTLPESSRPAIATTTATPETTTARPLVAAAMSIASRRLAPRARSSRARRT